MYNPLVSIIIPVYNGAQYMRESIDSALAQTYKNIEVIVVNDGSTDDGETESIALSYGNKIRYFRKENGGVSTALNLGIEKMSGEWFSWLSHDDLYLPGKIESAIEEVITNKLNNNKTIISCKSGLINSDGEAVFYPKKLPNGLFYGKEMFRNLLVGSNLEGCSLLIPKGLLTEIGSFCVEYRFIQDWVCWMELALKDNSFYIYDKVLVKSRVHSNQSTIKLAKLQPIEVDDYLSKLLSRLSDNVSESSYHIKNILFYYCGTSRGKEILKKYITKLKENNQFNLLTRLQFVIFLIRGKLIRIIKKVYWFIMNIKHRSFKRWQNNNTRNSRILRRT